MKQTFKEFVESQFDESLSEGLRDTINNSKIGQKINRTGLGNRVNVGAHNIKQTAGYLASKAAHLTGLSASSSPKQLDNAVNHMDTHYGADSKKVVPVILAHPKSTDAHLASAVRHSAGDVQAAVRHPNSGAKTLGYATSELYSAKASPVQTKALASSIINHPKVSADDLHKVAHFALNAGHEDTLRKVLNHPKTSSETLERIADSKHVNTSDLHTIAQHPNGDTIRVKTSVIGNNKTSPSTIRDIANSKGNGNDYNLHARILQHENTDPGTIHNIVTGKNGDHYKMAAVSNPNTWPETLHHITQSVVNDKDAKWSHIHQLLDNPKTPSSALRLIHGVSSHFHQDAENHPNGQALRNFRGPIN